eukprot:492170-Pleurochrysis_carterae.AAC.1
MQVCRDSASPHSMDVSVLDSSRLDGAWLSRERGSAGSCSSSAGNGYSREAAPVSSIEPSVTFVSTIPSHATSTRKSQQHSQQHNQQQNQQQSQQHHHHHSVARGVMKADVGMGGIRGTCRSVVPSPHTALAPRQ